jgi:hypothetical protein
MANKKFKRRIRVGLRIYTYTGTERQKDFANFRVRQLREKGRNAVIREFEDHKGKFYRIYVCKKRK